MALGMTMAVAVAAPGVAVATSSEQQPILGLASTDNESGNLVAGNRAVVQLTRAWTPPEGPRQRA